MAFSVRYNEWFALKEEADRFVESTYKSYPPQGYMTSLRVVPVENGFRVVGSRSTSCD